MREAGVSSLVVERRDETDEFGLVAITDIAREVTSKDRPADRVNVYEVMAKPVICVDAGMDIRYCARLFDRFDISRAPVIEAGEVVGVVTFTELVLRGMR